MEVLDSFDNLGPIVDFVVVDLDRQGQGQVILNRLLAQDDDSVQIHVPHPGPHHGFCGCGPGQGQGQGQEHPHVCLPGKREMSQAALSGLHGWQKVCCDRSKWVVRKLGRLEAHWDPVAADLDGDSQCSLLS